MADAPATLGGLEILGPLSAGGMGEVRLARKRGAHGFETLVAVKLIRPELANRKDVVGMFLSEAKIAARLSHPTIVQVHDFGDEAGTLYLVMELVEGLSLSNLTPILNGLKDADARESLACRIVAAVCRGLHAAHSYTGADGRRSGVVHRDVTPDNVMLTFDGAVKLLDFGIAAALERGGARPEALRGKLRYMAPEQLELQATDRRTDVYGAGLVLYELVHGSPAFGDLEREGALAARRAGVSVVPSTRCQSILTRALAFDVESRFESAEAMASALDNVITTIEGPTLESFARSALGEERERHRGRIRSLESGGEGASAVGDAAEGRSTPTLVASGGTHVGAPDEDEMPPAEPEPPTYERPSSSWAWVALPLLFAFMGSLAVIGSQEQESPQQDHRPELTTTASQSAQPELRKVEREAPVVPANVVESSAAKLPVPNKRRTASRRRRTTPSKDVGPGAREPKSPAVIDYGYLTIGATPYALVVVDGRSLGVTPLFRHKLAAGSHEVKLLDPASRALRTRRRVLVKADELTRLTIAPGD